MDARRPSNAEDPGEHEGIDSFLVGAPHDVLAHDCWRFSETSVLNGLNQIDSLTPAGDDLIRIQLLRPITPGAVSALTYLGSWSSGLFASHPGNVNGDGSASPADILILIDVINGVREAPSGIYSTDCDHSGATGPPDVLCLIDLLNGVDTRAWLNTAIPSAPLLFPLCDGFVGLPCPPPMFCETIIPFCFDCYGICRNP